MKINENFGGKAVYAVSPQILRIMKITTLIIIVSLMQVSALTKAQISIHANKEPIRKVLKDISQQTGYDLVFTDQDLQNTAPVSLQITNASLETVLNTLFKDQPLVYQLNNKTIMVQRKTPSFLDNLVARFAAIDVRGVVVDGESGLALAGASVKVKGSGKATTTGSDGSFYLPSVDEKDVIVVSFIGYVTRELKAKRDLGEVRLVIGSAELDEVMINKGYYTESKRLSTGSIGRVTAAEISRQPVGNPLAALYGKVPGLVVTQISGVPGGNFNIEIRGQNSLRNSTSDNGNIPLYIVDGVPFSSTPLSNPSVSINIYPAGVNGLTFGVTGASPFNNLNPSDIESIEILKDADATAIYGARGANGVVLITTKKGKVERMSIDINVYSGAGKVTRTMETLNTQQYLEMRQEAYKNDNISTIPINAYDINGTWDQRKYTNWQKELIGGTAQTTDAQLSISGGNESSRYRIGGGYHKENTVFPGNFGDQRGSMIFSLSNTSPNKKFKSEVSINYSFGKTNLLVQDLTGSAMTYVPNAPDLLDANGSLNWPIGVTSNPLQYTRRPYNANSENMIISANIGYEFLNGFSIQSNFGYTNSTRKEIAKIPLSSNLPSIQQFLQNSSRFGNSSNDSWIIEPQIDWNKELGSHSFKLLVGSTFQNQNSEALFQEATGFTSEALMENVSAVLSANVTNSFMKADYRYSAIYARLNYDYSKKYIINLTARRDGSSRFGPGRQFGNFGAIGAAWIFSKEDNVKRVLPILSYGKLRGSYGSSGSDQTLDYAFLDLYGPSSQYDGTQGLGPSRLYNPDFGWEKNRKLELALELGFLKDRILLTTAWYRNRSSNQLVGYPLPPSTGFPTVVYNLDAKIENRGLEFELNYVNVKSTKFTWSSSLNLSIPKSKLLSYPNIESSSYASTYIVGKPLNIGMFFQYTGINPITGLYQVLDVDHNGTFNAIDRNIIRFLGQKFSGGLNNSLQWEGLQLDFMFQFVKQEGRSILTSFAVSPGAMQNMPVAVMDRWQKAEDVAVTQQRSSTNQASPYSRFSSSNASLTDASFIRLKNASISYRIPSMISRKIKLQNARLYILGQNLLTITRFNGLDPETQGTSLPPLRILTAGLQLTF